ncbi:MAG: hypothetical protein HQK82_13395 [Desulfovibrionaceae bacterium]|nr:hypothetical protein [Desulfovibrionaceae bacterium]
MADEQVSPGNGNGKGGQPDPRWTEFRKDVWHVGDPGATYDDPMKQFYRVTESMIFLQEVLVDRSPMANEGLCSVSQNGLANILNLLQNDLYRVGHALRARFPELDGDATQGGETHRQ